MDPVTAMLRNQTLFAQHVRGELDAILGAKGAESSSTYTHENFKYAALSLSILYRLNHPANELRGVAWLRDAALQLVGNWLEHFESAPDDGARLEVSRNLAEWPSFISGQVVELLGEESAGPLRERARRFVSAWAQGNAMTKAFGQTSPNHEAWRILSLYRNGELFGEPAWKERALFFLRQLYTLQTPEGFWEEGRHHGPSMKYNCLMLSPLAWLYRLTGEAWIGDGARRLARFMATYTFPDGMTVGSFDGRQSTSPAFWAPVCPGLELLPEGVTLNQRGVDLWERRGMLSEPRAIGPSNWYTHFGCFFIGDALRYYTERVKETPLPAPLAIDAPQAEIESHSPYFSGLLRRWGTWALALSGQESDVAKDGGGVYRLERQSRLELWHARAGVVLGGGHNITGSPVPLANVHLESGAEGHVEFGSVKPVAEKVSRVLYMPRTIRLSREEGACRMSLHFSHGSVSWLAKPRDEDSFVLEARWTVAGVGRLCLQLPLLLWRGGLLRADGKVLEGRAPGLSGPVRAVEVRDAVTQTWTSLAVPAVGETRVRLGLEPLRTYGKLFEVEHFEPPYHLLLVSTQIDAPMATGTAVWDLRCRMQA